MRNKIIGSIIILILSLLSVYPLLITEQSDYSSLVFIAYYRLFLWVVWCFMILIFFISVFISKETRKKYWKLYLFNFLMVFLIAGGVSFKLQIDNNNRSQAHKKIVDLWNQKLSSQKDLKIEELKSIIRTEGSPEAYYNFGFFLRTEGKYSEAMIYLTKAVELDSLNGQYHSELARCLSSIQIGKYDDAIRHYEIAFELDKTKNWIKGEITRCERLIDSN